MKPLTRAIDLVLYTSIFTAFCAMGLCMATERLINSFYPSFFSHLHALVFGSSLLVYNTQHMIKWQRYTIGPHREMRSWYFVFFSLGMCMVAASLFVLPSRVLVTCVILSLFTFTYSWPLLPFPGRKRIREYGWLKILVLAGVWTIVTSILPILYYDKSIIGFPLEVALRFVFIFTLCVIFDIRDMRTDAMSNIDTLPNKLGIRNSYRVINAALILFVTLSVVQYSRHPVPGRLLGAAITALATRYVATYLERHPSARAYMALADGMMMLYASLILATPSP